jgi:hypothetical protein
MSIKTHAHLFRLANIVISRYFIFKEIIRSDILNIFSADALYHAVTLFPEIKLNCVQLKKGD